MSNPNFLTDDDLWGRMGGKPALTQLIDPQKTGVWNTTTAELARQDACNEVIAAAGVQVQLISDVATFRANFPHLVTIAAQLAIVNVWTYGTSGQAMPDRIQQLQTQVVASLELLAQRRRAHGSVNYVPDAAQKFSGSVSLDPGDTRLTLSNWKDTPFC